MESWEDVKREPWSPFGECSEEGDPVGPVTIHPARSFTWLRGSKGLSSPRAITGSIQCPVSSLLRTLITIRITHEWFDY